MKKKISIFKIFFTDFSSRFWRWFRFRKIRKVLQPIIIFILITAWLFSGFLRIGNVPPEVEKAQAAIIAQYTGGIVAYSDTANVGTPKYKTFDDTSGFGSEQSASSVGSNAIEYIRVAACPTRDEWIIATRDSGDVIKAQVCTGVDGGISCGTPTTITSTAGTHGFRNFDVEYEMTSGDALLVYGTATADELRKIEWGGSSWANDAAITTTRTSGTVEWVELTARRGSNQIGIAYSDDADDVSAYRWNGSSAADEATAVITATASVADVRKFDVSFEGITGDMLVVAQVNAAGTWATGQLVSTTWTIGDQTGVDNIGAYIDMANGAAGTDDLAIVSSYTNVFEGAEWSGTALVDGAVAVDTTTGTWASDYHWAATSYVSATYNGVAVYEDTTGTDDINWMTMDSAGTWTAQTDNTRSRGVSRIIEAYDYPNADKVIVFTEDANSDLWADTWNGATPSSTVWVDRTSGGALETDLTSATRMQFDFAFRLDSPPGIIGTLGKTADGWSGAVPVYGTLNEVSYGDYPYARAYVTTIASQTFYAPMTWDSGDSRFEGTIYIGSNICMGCDDPKTYNGSFSVVVQLDNDSGFGSINYSSSAATFTTAVTLKRSSMDNVTATNYTDFNAVWSTDHWNISIDDFGFAMNAGTGTNFAVAVPIHPDTSTPSNFAVTFNGTSVSQGSAQTSGSNAWWYDSASHTLYLQFASLTTTLVDVDIDFDSDTDLFATRYNWTYTADMGSRKGSNGLYIANRYLTTFYYGKPLSTADNNVACSGNECEMTGMQAESRAHEDGGPDESTDCMERVAVHVDGTARSDATTYYQYDIKWKQSETPTWITSQSDSQMVLVANSDDTASTGWAQQLNNGIAAERTQTFYAGKRYIKNLYEFTNNSASSHSYPLVWEREQWHGTDRATNDHGRFQGDTSDRVMEERIAMSGLSCPWQTAYDSGTFINMGMIFDKNDLPDYGVFAVEPFLAPAAYEWPITITDVHGTQTADQTGFEKTWSSVAASQTVSYTFWHVHNAESSWANIETAMDDDCWEINPPIISLTISDGVVDYGNVVVGTPEDTTGVGGDSQTVTNNGNVPEDFEIVGQNSANWTLGSSAGNAIYKHAFCTSSCDSSPTWTALTASYQTLATGVSVSGTSVFDLQITVPTSNAGTNQQNVHVTVRAIQN